MLPVELLHGDRGSPTGGEDATQQFQSESVLLGVIVHLTEHHHGVALQSRLPVAARRGGSACAACYGEQERGDAPQFGEDSCSHGISRVWPITVWLICMPKVPTCRRDQPICPSAETSIDLRELSAGERAMKTVIGVALVSLALFAIACSVSSSATLAGSTENSKVAPQPPEAPAGFDDKSNGV